MLSRTPDMGDSTAANPLTSICIVSDKNKCPIGFVPITKSFDDQVEADVWKDGFFSMSRVYRYIAFSKEIQQNAFVVNVVADICVVADRDVVPNGFVPIEFTEDTREKALRKKQLCVRSVPRDSAVDAVCDLIILSRQKKPPAGYSIAGEIDGLTICYKYGVIPKNFGSGHSKQGGGSLYPNVPYPVHPGQQSSQNGEQPSLPSAVTADYGDINGAGAMTVGRQTSNKGIEGVPFELNALLKASLGHTSVERLPDLRPIDAGRLERDYVYRFNLERATIANSPS